MDTIAITIDSVISKRNMDDRVFFDVCFEWEDIIADILHAKIVSFNKLEYIYKRIKGKFFPWGYNITQDYKYPLAVFFVMSYTDLKYYYGKNALPIFLDIWSDEAIKFVDRKLGSSFFYVTSLDVYNRFVDLNKLSGAHYMPLSVSDKYFSEYFDKYEKTVDVIQIGRRNEVLHRWMLDYVKNNPDIEYIYSQEGNTRGKLNYISTRKGNIGKIVNREQYIKLLGSAKVSLVSTPGVDNSRENNKFGVDFPTPRFYESAVTGNYMIGRYTNNSENERIERVCPLASDYDFFCNEISRGISTSKAELYRKYKDFIISNMTSCRVRQLINDLHINI